MANLVETSFGYSEIGDNKGFFSSNERRWINHIKRLAEKNPECVILAEPESNHGFIYAQMPTSWLKVKPPKKIEMSEEQRAALADRMRKLRQVESDD